MGLSRREKLLTSIKPSRQRGIEIGPLNRPILSKSEAEVYFLDYTTLEELKRIHSVDPNIPQDKICAPDFIWGKAPLAEELQKVLPLNFVLASHVIEHVPDMIGWFKELSSILCANGTISLAVPDKRFTFDYLRPLTTLGDVLEAHFTKAKRPAIRHVWDAVSMTIKLDAEVAWKQNFDPNKLERYNTYESALNAIKGNMADDSKYYDCHCWVITPNHLLSLWRDLSIMGFFDFAVEEFYPTVRNEIEFFVSLKKLPEEMSKAEKLAIQLRAIDKYLVPTEELVIDNDLDINFIEGNSNLEGNSSSIVSNGLEVKSELGNQPTRKSNPSSNKSKWGRIFEKFKENVQFR